MAVTASYLRDLGERVVAVYLYALVTALILAPSLDADVLQAAAVAAIPAALATIKGALAHFIGNPEDASLRRK